MGEARLRRLGGNPETRHFLLEVGNLTLYEWEIENAVQFGRKTRKYSGVEVMPCNRMMVNIEKRWKYSWHMSIEDALECLERCGIDPTEFIETAEKAGWKINWVIP